MFAECDQPTRVGIRALVVAALVGLIVLIFNGSAAAQDEQIQQAAQTLSDREPMTPSERVEVAESKIGAERKERLLRAHARLLEIGWQVLTQASPRRVLSETRDLAKELWSWRKPYRVEPEALEWLEPAVAVSSDDPELIRLYTKMHAREVEQARETALDQADAAVSRGHFAHADARLRRVLELATEDEESAERAEKITTRLQEARTTVPAFSALAEAPIELAIADWEAPLSAALLAGHYDRALELGTDEPSAVLARETARYLLGDLEPAVKNFEALAERDDRVGQLAKGWSSRPDVNARRAFEKKSEGYQITRVLGWIGGTQLATNGRALSGRGYRAWRDSLTPFNVAFSVPTRIYRDYRPDNEDLYEAAFEYVAQVPDGSEADDTRAWLAQDMSLLNDWRSRGWSSGRLLLDAPTTRFQPMTPEPLLLTRELVDSGTLTPLPQLEASFAGASAVLIELETSDSEGEALPWKPSLTLLGELATMLEQSASRSVGSDNGRALDHIRRLEAQVRSGRRLIADSLPIEAPSLVSTFTGTMLEGTSERAGALRFSRGEEEFYALREFGGSAVHCPENTVCLDEQPLLAGTFYGKVDLEDLNVGVQTTFRRAYFAIGVNNGLPNASLVLPIAYWLGLSDYVPVEAQVAIGVDSVSFGPRLNPER
jgi:hypothetical protein